MDQCITDTYFTRSLRRVVAAVAAAALAISPLSAGAMQSPFQTTRAQRHGDLSAFAKWTSLMPRYNSQKSSANQCPNGDCPAAKWEALITELKGKPVREQLDAVNEFFNAVKYVEDKDNYGKEDYWATPYELINNGGDCEDYAVAKYITLKRLGVPENAMRVIILQDNNLGGIMHAVLGVRVGEKQFILDNQAKSVTADADIYHYKPIYAINRSAWWTYN